MHAIPVGVGDVGLGDRQGRPLPAAMFYITDEDRLAAIDEAKENPDGGSLEARLAEIGVGSGAERPATNALAPSRDVGLCPGALNPGLFTDEKSRRFINHGAIVASLAGGMRCASHIPI